MMSDPYFGITKQPLSPRDREAELIRIARDAVHAQDRSIVAVLELMRLRAEKDRDALVTAEGLDVSRRQGAVRALEKLFKDITTPSPAEQAVQKNQ